MFYFLSKIVWFFLRPSNFLFFILALSFLSSVLNLPKLSFYLLSCVLLFFSLLIFTPFAAMIGHPLEAGFKKPDDLQPYRGFIVLGGSLDIARTQYSGRVEQDASSERMIEMVNLMRAYPDKQMVFSGGGYYQMEDGARKSEADIARLFIQQSGLSIDSVLFEGESKNTWQNASMSYGLVRPKADDRWLIVTSAWHMPRAIGSFRKAGWRNVDAFPVDYRLTSKLTKPRMALGRNLEMLDLFVKEWVGLISYWLAGRSTSIFPKQL